MSESMDADDCQMNKVTNGIATVDLNNCNNQRPSTSGEENMHTEDLEDLPNILIITNVAESVFDNEDSKVRSHVHTFKAT